MASPPPSPPPSPTSIFNQEASGFSSIENTLAMLLHPPYIFMVLTLVVVIGIAVIIRLAVNAKTPPIFKVDYRNADAIFIIYRSKLNDVLILPAKYVMQGLFMAKYKGEVFLIATHPSIQPIRSSTLWNKPVYFAYGESPVILSYELESMTQNGVIKFSSEKSLSEVIAEILNSIGKVTGNIPLGSSYKLYITIDARKVLQDKGVSFLPDITNSVVQMLKIASENAMEIAKIGLVAEKLKLKQTFGRNQLIIMILMIAMITGIIMFVLTTFKP